MSRCWCSDGPADRVVPAVPESRESRAAADALAAILLVRGS